MNEHINTNSESITIKNMQEEKRIKRKKWRRREGRRGEKRGDGTYIELIYELLVMTH